MPVLLKQFITISTKNYYENLKNKLLDSIEKEYRIVIAGSKAQVKKIMKENPGAVNMGYGNWGGIIGWKIEIPIPKAVANNKIRREMIKKTDELLSSL